MTSGEVPRHPSAPWFDSPEYIHAVNRPLPRKLSEDEIKAALGVKGESEIVNYGGSC